MAPANYEIRVTGTLPPEALADFECLTVSVEPAQTTLHGPLPDRAALHGLLARLELLGAQVLDIHRLPARKPPPRHPKDWDPPQAQRPG